MIKTNGNRPWRFPDLFRKPKKEVFFRQEPLRKRILQFEISRSPDILGRAINTDVTEDFFNYLWHKTHQNPPENVTLEIKGQPRSGKSTIGIFLYMWLCKVWEREPSVDNIMGNQAELLYRLKDAEYGETFIVDEQTPETYGDGIIAETDQLFKNINICAKKCNNLIFIFPPRFAIRGSPYGLETLGKDTKTLFNQSFLYDLTRREMGFGNFPMGYIATPKYIDEKYDSLPMAKWSERRKQNYIKRGYSFTSLIEEQYELDKKDIWIEEVRKLSGNARNKMKEEFSKELAGNPDYLRLRSAGQRRAYVQIKVNKGDIIEMAKSEIEGVVDMAEVFKNE